MKQLAGYHGLCKGRGGGIKVHVLKGLIPVFHGCRILQSARIFMVLTHLKKLCQSAGLLNKSIGLLRIISFHG